MGAKTKLRRFLKQNSLGKGVWRLLHNANITWQGLLYSDEAYFKKVYKQKSGKELDFDNPRTFDEKQLWLKMYYRDPKCTICADKYKVREYVADKGYEHILNPVYGVYDNAQSIAWDDLPDRFYLKCNHMSGSNVRCNDKSTFDKKAAQKILSRGLKHDYSKDSREWVYHDIERKIIAEAIIESKDKAPLVDYRFLCSGGRCEYMFIDIDTAGDDGSHLEGAKRNVYDRDMNLIDVTVSRPRFDAALVKKPDNFDEMVKCAEALSGDFPFCRVDLYNIDGKILFGEITFFHAGGLSTFSSEEWSYKLGDSIDLSLAKPEYIRKVK